MQQTKLSQKDIETLNKLSKNIVTCYKCKKDYDVVMKEKDIAGTTQLYYECPHCNDYVRAFRTDVIAENLHKDAHDQAVAVLKTKDKKLSETLIKIYQTTMQNKMSRLRLLNGK